jgi:mannose-6-phosphate isomerase-like protein (cupin superfamily)
MKKLQHSDTGDRGWFIGNFEKAVVRTQDFEVCWQSNPAGAKDTPHYHKVITEVQLIIRGRMIINGVEFGPGDIYVSDPGEHYYGEYLEDTEVVAIKFPSVPTDKYYI